MKVLFICRSNAERSQTGEMLFNITSKKNKAISAGICVDEENGIGLPAGRGISEALKRMGYDMSKAKRKQLTQDMVDGADIVIVTLSASEILQLVPKYVLHSPKARMWEIEPPSLYVSHEEVIANIKKKVEELVKEIG